MLTALKWSSGSGTVLQSEIGSLSASNNENMARDGTVCIDMGENDEYGGLKFSSRMAWCGGVTAVVDTASLVTPTPSLSTAATLGDQQRCPCARMALNGTD